ncbi:MAG: Lrp/AsnC family transcriptional regulator [archaeon]|nr:Lrp/AsnC family transcriptional regulator [archaeon]
MKELDKTDKSILNLLQDRKMCVPRTTKIAHKMQIPTTTLHSRLKNLEKTGVIKGYQAVLDPKKAGAKVTIFAVVKVVYEKVYSDEKVLSDFGSKLAAIPEVLEVHACSGDWDYLIKLKVRDTEEYRSILGNKILPLGGIEKVESAVAYWTFKEETRINVK